MKKTTLTLLISLFTASSLFSTLSYADGPGNGPDRQWHQDRGHDNRGDDRHDDRDRGDWGHSDRGRAGPHERDHFAWNGHDFRRGHPAPERFRGDDYRVNDWRDRGLYEPPHGAHWAYVDGNYVLIAAATGVITSIIIGSLSGNR
ncbi:RcnB family protein [Erwinia sp. Eh17-17]|uniref:RcnB family protein n=1 Tax=Erwinia sp. Eh17-17 TaxID=3080330 RepID=UPI00320AA475